MDERVITVSPSGKASTPAVLGTGLDGLDLIHASSHPRCIRWFLQPSARKRQGNVGKQKETRSFTGALAYRVSAAACASGHGIGQGYLESTKVIKRLCLCSYTISSTRVVHCMYVCVVLGFSNYDG